MQILHSLSFISNGFDHNIHADLPVLTTTHRLLGITEVFEDDAPHLKRRIDITGIDVIAPEVPARIRSAAPRLTDAVVELLSERPTVSTDRQLEETCQRLVTTLHSEEFLYGIKRLIAQTHSWRVDEFSLRFDHFDLYPAISINTDLYFHSQNRAPLRIGGGAVPVFVDIETSEIWIASVSRRLIIMDLARTIDRLLGELQGVDLAALEDMLRVARAAEIVEVLNERRVPELREAEQRTFVWSFEHELSDAPEETEADSHGDVDLGVPHEPQKHRPIAKEPSTTHKHLPSTEGIVRELIGGLSKPASSRDRNGGADRINGSDLQVELPPLEKVSLLIAQQSEDTVSATVSASRS